MLQAVCQGSTPAVARALSLPGVHDDGPLNTQRQLLDGILDLLIAIELPVDTSSIDGPVSHHLAPPEQKMGGTTNDKPWSRSLPYRWAAKALSSNPFNCGVSTVSPVTP